MRRRCALWDTPSTSDGLRPTRDWNYRIVVLIDKRLF